jgi:hypothetical protein
MSNKKMLGKDLQLRDVVKTGDFVYCHGTVVRIDKINELVYIFRPYVHCADFEFADGVLRYIGSELYTIGFNSNVTLVERQNDRLPLLK